MRLSKAVEGFAIAFMADGKSNETLKAHRKAFAKLVAFVGDKDVESITVDDLRGFMKWLATEYKPNRSSRDTSPLRSGSLARIWAALRSFWKWAVVEFQLKSNPATALKMPKVDTRAVMPLCEDDIRRLLKAAERDRSNAARDQALIVTLLDTGLRAGELARLKLLDADLNTGQVEVRSVGSGTKSKSRIVILGKSARRYIWRYLASRDDADDQDAPLLALVNGRPMDRGNIRNAIARLGKRAGAKAKKKRAAMGAARRASCEYHNFFAVKLVRNLARDQVEVRVILDKVQIVGWNRQHGTKRKIGGPLFVKVVELRQIVGGNLSFELAPALGDAPAKRGDAGAEIHDEVRRGQEQREHFVQLAVAFVIALGHVALPVKIASENLGVFVHTSILHNRVGMIEQSAMMAQPPREEENLRMKAPCAHVLVKVGQVGIVLNRLIERFPVKLLGQQASERGFADADVACDGDKVFHRFSSCAM